MSNDPDEEVARLAACATRASIVAAAGCGKTEQIAKSTLIAEGRRLILTHTHAGVDALRTRLKKHAVRSEKFRIDTIAGWSLRYAASFPKRSDLHCAEPRSDEEWRAVYESAAKLLNENVVGRILTASYTGAFVDEYQDCTDLQHRIVKAIASFIPVCVFGDPMQAIFDFKGQKPVDWENEVFPHFARAAELSRPWRWENQRNKALATWLSAIRVTLERGGPIDLTNRPECVRWEQLPADNGPRQGKIVGTCKSVMGRAPQETLIVIGDAANMNARAGLAQKLAVAGFSNIEPVSCRTLYEAAKKIAVANGFARLEAVMDFICACMTGADRKDFLDAVRSRQGGGRFGRAKFGDVVALGVAVANNSDDESVLELMDAFQVRTETHPFRREMYFAMRSALRIKCARQDGTVEDAVWEVQNRIRHAGRLIGRRSVGSTLLVKGLEFDHSVVIHAEKMTRRDWYVAFTRAGKTLTILSPAQQFTPAA